MGFGWGAFVFDEEAVFVGLTAQGAGLEAFEVDGGVAERGEEEAEAAGFVGEFDDESGAVVGAVGGERVVAEAEELGDVGDVAGDGEVKEVEAVAVGVLAGADGGGVGFSGGEFGGGGGAGAGDAAGGGVVGLQPFVGVEEGHGVGVDDFDGGAGVTEEGEFDIEGEFFLDPEGAAVVNEAVDGVDDEAAGGVFDGDDAFGVRVGGEEVEDIANGDEGFDGGAGEAFFGEEVGEAADRAEAGDDGGCGGGFRRRHERVVRRWVGDKRMPGRKRCPPVRSTVAVGECPEEADFGLGGEGEDEGVGAGLGRVDAGGGPEFGFLLVDLDGFAFVVEDFEVELGAFVGGGEPEGVFVAFEELVFDHELLAALDFAVPVVFTNDEALFDEGDSGLHGEGVGVIDTGMSGGEDECDQEGGESLRPEGGQSKEGKGERVHRRGKRGLALLDDGCDFGQERVALAADGANGFLGESIDGAFHFGEDIAEAGEDFDDERVFPGGGGGLADDGEEMLDQHGLVEEFGAICGEGFGDDGGDGGGAAEPAAEADALGEVFVAHLFHGGADGLLGEIKLFANGFPVVLIGGVEDGLSVREDGFADAEGFGEVDDFAADVFDGLFVFGLNGDEAFGDDVTEDEGEEDAVAGLREFEVANFLAPVGLAKFV